jgi:hypothetical protein
MAVHRADERSSQEGMDADTPGLGMQQGVIRDRIVRVAHELDLGQEESDCDAVEI